MAKRKNTPTPEKPQRETPKMDTTVDPVHQAAYEALLVPMPGVKVGKAFGYPAYKVNGKVFAFAGRQGLAIKLPEARVAALAGSKPEFSIFGPTLTIQWKGWLKITPETADHYGEYEPLFLESLTFVAESAS